MPQSTKHLKQPRGKKVAETAQVWFSALPVPTDNGYRCMGARGRCLRKKTRPLAKHAQQHIASISHRSKLSRNDLRPWPTAVGHATHGKSSRSPSCNTRRPLGLQLNHLCGLHILGTIAHVVPPTSGAEAVVHRREEELQKVERDRPMEPTGSANCS